MVATEARTITTGTLIGVAAGGVVGTRIDGAFGTVGTRSNKPSINARNSSGDINVSVINEDDCLRNVVGSVRYGIINLDILSDIQITIDG